jgi:hypothetical protein
MGSILLYLIVLSCPTLQTRAIDVFALRYDATLATVSFRIKLRMVKQDACFTIMLGFHQPEETVV